MLRDPERQAVATDAREEPRQAEPRRGGSGARGAHATWSDPETLRSEECSCRTSVRSSALPCASCTEATTREPVRETIVPEYARGEAGGPKSTLLEVICTPPFSSGTPFRSTCSRPFAPPPTRALTPTVTRPSAPGAE